MRFDKIVVSQGVLSRREATRAIRAKKITVTINGEGEVCKDSSKRFDETAPDFSFTYNEITYKYQAHLYLLMNKPVGYECSHEPEHHPSVDELLDETHRRRGMTWAGRLDMDTSGLLVLSDDGKFLHRISSPSGGFHKYYVATLAEPLTQEQHDGLLSGIMLKNEPNPFCAVSVDGIGSTTCNIVLSEGKYHQVKRMLASVGNHVTALHRERLGDWTLPGGLPEGEWMVLPQPS